MVVWISSRIGTRGRADWTSRTSPCDEKLCLQMKWMEPADSLFVSHIRDDHKSIQFLEAAYQGDRALGAEELARLKLKAEAPPGSQAQLTEQAKQWVKILGKEGYAASKECGCVMLKLKLKVHHTHVLTVPRGLSSKEASETRFEVAPAPMGEERPNYYRGQFSQTRVITYTLPKN